MPNERNAARGRGGNFQAGSSSNNVEERMTLSKEGFVVLYSGSGWNPNGSFVKGNLRSLAKALKSGSLEISGKLKDLEPGPALPWQNSTEIPRDKLLEIEGCPSNPKIFSDRGITVYFKKSPEIEAKNLQNSIVTIAVETPTLSNDKEVTEFADGAYNQMSQGGTIGTFVRGTVYCVNRSLQQSKVEQKIGGRGDGR